MKRFVTNIGVCFLALTVFCLSVGFNVTKLTCNEITTITLGDNSLCCSTSLVVNLFVDLQESNLILLSYCEKH